MDFFNKAKEKITKTSSDVAKKAKDLSEISKLNAQITTNEAKIKATYSEIGQYVYENLKDDAPEEIAAKMAFIDKALAEIENIKNEILKVKGSQKCAQCGSEVSAEVAFCPSCGNKMPEPVVDVVDEGEVKEVVEDVVENAESKVEEVVDKVEDVVENVAEKVEETVEAVADKVEDVVE